MAVALSTYQESIQPIEAPVIETPIVETPVVETPVIETPVVETPVVETIKEENVSDFNIAIDGEQPVVETPAPTHQQPVYNWKDEIKKIDRKELLKEAGVNEFAVEIDEYLAKGGKASDYLNAKSIDYNQISDESLVKEDLRKQFVGFSKEEIDRLFITKYPNLDSDIDEEKDDALLKLRADAYLNRQQKIEQQQKFKIPETPILHTDEAYEQWKQNQESQPKLIEQAKNYFLNHEATKTLNESKRVTINLGEGVAPFNFNVDKPEMITKNLTDGGETWNKLTSTATGEPDVAKQQLLTLIAFNPQRFIQDIFNYGLSTGARKLVAEGQNAQKPSTPVHSITGEKGTYSTGTYGGGKQ